MEERLFIANQYVPLTSSLNPSLSKSVTDIEQPDKRKSAHSKTVRVPDSKELRIILKHYYEFNGTNSYNTAIKQDVRYECASETMLEGYIRLSKVIELDNNNIEAEFVMFGQVANFFSDIKNGYLTDLYESTADFEGLDIYDHQLTKELQQLSWATSIIKNGVLEAFAYGKGYVYALVDFGFSQDATKFIYTQIAPSIYEKEYMNRIIAWAGYTVQAGGWMATDDVINHLIVPSSPECYQLTDADIALREFAANTPELTSTGTTTSDPLPIGEYSVDDIIIFTNDSVAPAFDTNGNYNPVTGEYTASETGVYNINALIDINATFTPDLGTNVKTICDIQGYLMVFHTPFGGIEAQIDALPFYITKDDSTFYAGARSTSSTPTYPNTDYMSGKAWGKLIQTTPAARAVSPPDRYQLTMLNVPLHEGDIVTIKWKAGIFGASVTPFVYGSEDEMFIDAGATKSNGEATITISVGSFYNKVSNLTMTEGNNLQMLDVISKQIKMFDYFMSNVKRFNLIVDYNEDNPKELIIKTRDAYFGSTTIDMDAEELVDRSKEIESIPLTSLDVKQYYYAYKPDKDYFNERYTKSWVDIYGERRVDVLNEFAGQEKKIEVIFSPTCMVGLPHNDRVLPTIYALNDYNQPVTKKFNIRSLYYGGLKPCLNGWQHINYVSVFGIEDADTHVTYPYAGHFDDPYTPTLDINFGLVKEVYYYDDLHPIVVTNNNLTNKYHSKQLRELTDPTSRIVKAWVHLRPYNYKRFTFTKKYYFDNCEFRLQEIEGFNPTSNESTLCTFLKIVDVDAFVQTDETLTGYPGPVGPASTGGGNITLTEYTPAKGTRAMDQADNNNYASRSVVVQGEFNYVAATSKNVEVYGDSNKVWHEAKNIKIQGSGNTIDGGVTNVTLINTNDLHVTESNVTYINGSISEGNQYTPVASATVNLDSTPTVSTTKYFVSNGMVTVSGYFDADPTAPNVATSFEITLPIASNIGAIEDVTGTAACGAGAGESVQVLGSIANDTAVFTWVAKLTAVNRWSFIFQYRII